MKNEPISPVQHFETAIPHPSTGTGADVGAPRSAKKLDTRAKVSGSNSSRRDTLVACRTRKSTEAEAAAAMLQLHETSCPSNDGSSCSSEYKVDSGEGHHSTTMPRQTSFVRGRHNAGFEELKKDWKSLQETKSSSFLGDMLQGLSDEDDSDTDDGEDDSQPAMPLNAAHASVVQQAILTIKKKRNKRERLRWRKIRRGFAQLREILPRGEFEELSQLSTLRRASRYIHYLGKLLQTGEDDHEAAAAVCEDVDDVAPRCAQGKRKVTSDRAADGFIQCADSSGLQRCSMCKHHVDFPYDRLLQCVSCRSKGVHQRCHLPPIQDPNTQWRCQNCRLEKGKKAMVNLYQVSKTARPGQEGQQPVAMQPYFVTSVQPRHPAQPQPMVQIPARGEAQAAPGTTLVPVMYSAGPFPAMPVYPVSYHPHSHPIPNIQLPQPPPENAFRSGSGTSPAPSTPGLVSKEEPCSPSPIERHGTPSVKPGIPPLNIPMNTMNEMITVFDNIYSATISLLATSKINQKMTRPGQAIPEVNLPNISRCHPAVPAKFISPRLARHVLADRQRPSSRSSARSSSRNSRSSTPRSRSPRSRSPLARKQVKSSPTPERHAREGPKMLGNLPHCAACGQPSQFYCSVCYKTSYCSKSCQEKSWRRYCSTCIQRTRYCTYEATRPAVSYQRSIIAV